jgi:hypothetical protein
MGLSKTFAAALKVDGKAANACGRHRGTARELFLEGIGETVKNHGGGRPRIVAADDSSLNQGLLRTVVAPDRVARFEGHWRIASGM